MMIVCKIHIELCHILCLFMIDPRKINSFNSYMNHYKKKNDMSSSDFAQFFSHLGAADNHVFNSSTQLFVPIVPIKTIDTIIDFSMNSLSDLISIVDKYSLSDIKYNIDIKMLHSIHTELKELNSMVGIVTLKSAILDQLLYYIQGFHLCGVSDDYKHTVIYGPPGSGKTEIAKIIGRMYSKMNVIKKLTPETCCNTTTVPSQKNIFKKITRADLVAGYLGQTALKTKGVINECLGGVVFLDEAYSLGHKEGSDSFSKECADTLCESLSHYRENIMFIIAGYEKELESNFFSLNPGLDSRFVWRFKIDDYTYKDLWQIMISKIKVSGWTIDASLQDSGELWFKRKFEFLTGLGRDVDSLFFKTKISHSRRVYGKTPDTKCQINIADLNAGFDLFMKSKSGNAENEKRERKRIADSLYV